MLNFSREKEIFYKADHKYPSSQNSELVAAVLYGEIGSKSFAVLHHELKKLAAEGHIDYYVRHFTHQRSNKKVRLSGYGVELAVKNTEYKAQDDTKVEGIPFATILVLLAMHLYFLRMSHILTSSVIILNCTCLSLSFLII